MVGRNGASRRPLLCALLSAAMIFAFGLVLLSGTRALADETTFTVYYYEDVDATQPVGSQEIQYGVSTRTYTTEQLGISREGQVLKGWIAYRPKYGMWAYTTGTDVKWAQSCPDGYSIKHYNEGVGLATTVAPGESIEFYAVWQDNAYTIEYCLSEDATEPFYTQKVWFGQGATPISFEDMAPYYDGDRVAIGWYFCNPATGMFICENETGRGWAFRTDDTDVYVYSFTANISTTVGPGLVLRAYPLWVDTTLDVTDYPWGADGTDDQPDALAIQKALNIALLTDQEITVVIPEGTYHIDSALRVYSNTTLLLDENTRMVRDEPCRVLLKAVSPEGEEVGGYDKFTNITVIGGIWDGNVVSTDVTSCVMKFDHGTDVTIRDCTVQDSCGKHMVILDGVDGIFIDNVIFKDAYYYTGDTLIYGADPSTLDMDSLSLGLEALHIDSITLDGESATDSPPFDGTESRNVTVSNCWFDNVIAALGNHVEVDDRDPGFDILNNTFTNVKGFCINAYDRENARIEGNTAKNVGSFVRFIGSSGIIKNNTVEVTKYGEGATPWPSEGAIRPCIDVATSDNLIIEGNELKNSAASGIYVYHSDVTAISGNTVVTPALYGIWANYSVVASIDDNVVVDAPSHGISIVYAQADVSGNTVENSGGTGIYVGNALDLCTLSDNAIVGSAEYGVYALYSSVNIEYNTISQSNLYGILYSNPPQTAEESLSIQGNSIATAGTYGILVANANNLDILDNVVSDAPDFGILSVQSSNGRIDGNMTISSNIGIGIQSGTQISVRKNNVVGSVSCGIYAYANSTGIAENNMIAQNVVYAHKCPDFVVGDNTTYDAHEPGWAEENGVWRYYEINGTMRTDAWAEKDGSQVYLGPDGTMMTDTWLTLGDDTYYLDENGNPLAAQVANLDGTDYLFDANGCLAKDAFVTIDETTYYANQAGELVRDALIERNGTYFYLDADGALVRDAWIGGGKTWGYFDESGALAVSRLVTTGDTTYYVNASGLRVYNTLISLGGKSFYFGADGAMVKDAWIGAAKTWGYFDANGELAVSRLVTTGDKTYYVNAYGMRVYNTLINLDGKYYYFGTDGAMVKDAWIGAGLTWGYFTPSGELLVSSFVDIAGKTYYVNESGLLVFGKLVDIDGTYYYFGVDGAMVKDAWIGAAKTWGYFDANGELAVSRLVTTGDKTYYVNASGMRVYKTTIEIDGKYYYFGTDGAMVKDTWVGGGSTWYYFETSGELAIDKWVEYQGYRCHFNAQGVLDQVKEIA